MTVYMAVTEDKYELPVAIADSPSELGELCGCKGQLISSCISHARKRGSRSRFVKVELSEEECETTDCEMA